MLFWKKKKKKKKGNIRIVYRKPHIYNNISRTGEYKYKLWRTLHGMNFASVHLWIQSFDDMDKILVMATIALTTNEINRNLLNEAALIYVMYWGILSLIYYFENSNFRNRVIHWHCLNRLSKLTTNCQFISRLNADKTRLQSRIHPSLTDELSSPMINDM